MRSVVEQMFVAGGPIAQHLDGYRPRDGQIEYARHVELALSGGRDLLIEAGTGVGKSLGYLVPAIAHAVGANRKVCIATANIALQEQLIMKDLPLLHEALPWTFESVLAKGRGNYVCIKKAAEIDLVGFGDLSGEDREAAEVVTGWAGVTVAGDRSELPLEPSWRVWQKFSAGEDDCPGVDCAYYDRCWWVHARKQLERARIVVANYHLFFADLKIAADEGTHVVLPQFDVAILDEAHRAVDIARDFLGFRLGPKAVKRLGKFTSAETAAGLDREADGFFGALASKGPFRITKPNAVKGWKKIHTLILGAAADVDSRAPTIADATDRAIAKKIARRGFQIAMQIESAMTLVGEYAYFVTADPGRAPALCSKPLDVGPWLCEHLFEAHQSVIATSATLIEGGSFDYAVRELGAPDHAREAEVEAPFKWEDQAVLVLPPGIAPSAPDYREAVAESLVEIVRLARGRTLGLFTSWRNLNAAAAALEGADSGYPILVQGQMPRTALIEEFRDDPSSVLLGTDSFWGGIDVPGEALSCVVIDRLPFPRPDDPVFAALAERDRDWFFKHSLPRMCLALRQGVGRLIRGPGDRGVVVILDNRVTEKSYGRRVLASLPRMVKTRDLLVVRKFLDDVAHGAPQEDPADEALSAVGDAARSS